MNPPHDPLQAVGHPDPYPYYAQLRHMPLYRDATLGLWVASDAATVGAILEHPACLVRPAGELVPTALCGMPLGDWFGRLVRMNDGAVHRRLKPAVLGALSGSSPLAAKLDVLAADCAARLLADGPSDDPALLDRLFRRLPADSMGRLLGLPVEVLAEQAEALGAVAAALAPGASLETVDRGTAAIVALQRHYAVLLDCAAPDDLLAGLQQRLADREAVLANAIGFVWQAYDATAALLGLGWARLAEQPHWQDWLAVEPSRWQGWLAEVARCDAPIQNTRRFVADDCVIAGQALAAGDAILLVLAAANRDPALNAQADVFDPARATRRQFGFSHGPHACPGEPLALAIAAAGLRVLLTAGVAPARPTGFRPSPNARLPLFAYWEVSA